MSLRLVAGLIVMAVGAMFLLTACGGDNETPEEAYCKKLERLQTEVETLKSLDLATVPLGQLTDQFEKVGSAVAAVLEARVEVRQARTEELDSAFEGLGSTIASINADFSIAQAADAIRSALQDIEDSVKTLGTEVGCAQLSGQASATPGG